jgi:Skp family chaperone for outer membrane proteins
MRSKLIPLVVLTAFAFTVTTLAQTGNAGTPLPAAPGAANASAAAPAHSNGQGTRVGTINIQEAIVATNEGQRDFGALNKKFEPKRTELKSLSSELDTLKKQLNTQGDKMNEDARASLVKEIEQKQKTLTRSSEDAQNDYQSQQGEVAQRILQKMAPLLVKYADDNGFGVIIDTSNPWPNGPVLWSGPAVDITKPVVEAYNAQSNVPAPLPAAPTPSGQAKPSGAAKKPATAAPSKPPGAGTSR